MPRIQVGLNLPWYHYGADFGRRTPGVAVPQWQATIENDLARLHDIGFFALRWWLLGDGGHYGPNPERDATNLNWYVGGADAIGDLFIDDFIHMLQAASRIGMKIVPTLIDFGFCFDGVVAWRDQATGLNVVKGGRHGLINNDLLRARFLDRVLRPLVERTNSERLQNTIYAWDLINEPEWCTDVYYPHELRVFWERRTGHGWMGVRQANVELNKMKAYIREGSAIVNRAGFRSTVGFNDRDSPRIGGDHPWNDAELGVTLHQFHYRDNLMNLEPHNWSPEFPCFIGELSDGRQPYGFSYESSLAAPIHRNLYDRLQRIESLGYRAVFIWPENKPDERPFNYLSAEDEHDVRRYALGG
jgi:hypothetical protein